MIRKSFGTTLMIVFIFLIIGIPAAIMISPFVLWLADFIPGWVATLSFIVVLWVMALVNDFMCYLPVRFEEWINKMMDTEI